MATLEALSSLKELCMATGRLDRMEKDELGKFVPARRGKKKSVKDSLASTPEYPGTTSLPMSAPTNPDMKL
jgi:hypothetical protein